MTAPALQHVRIATRGSALALWQADHVASLLGSRGVTSDRLVIKTTADRIQNRSLHEIGGKGLFVKELEEALESGAADIAVHSLKDMTASLAAPFALAAVLTRHAAADVMIFRDDVAARLAPGARLAARDLAAFGRLTVGTGSLRRQALLAGAARQLTPAPVRGNVDTRIKKLKDGQFDALILAEASLDRLGLKESLAVSRLDTDWFVPCASQGALALETVAAHPLTAWLGSALGSPATTAAVGVERALLARLGGDCTMPFGCLVADADGAVVGRAVILAKDGREARAEHRGTAADVTSGMMLEALTDGLRAAGARDVLAALGLPVPAMFR